MRIVCQNATTLRAEARLLTVAGLILLAIGFPLTIALTLLALSPRGLSPIYPPVIGGPFLILGYVACHYASERLAKAKSLEPPTRDDLRRMLNAG
ncbi:MAG TPA: hypothetical protein VG841_05125 [Caulobacterales bacterium]|nr:hypothetical protein [Caulobacterales bacterium]